ncbi:hypothetical protein HPB50_026300 [Hyalomma asiaticum]|uniref:Uncharacterized protein n=1 Tax=Hyalomma asiaticum TaxID=266040 RepID=A0ACB7TP15_HYAAI|nr:hypothetical protein HPB50_026300 [Hyalomma asiaticum]
MLQRPRNVASPTRAISKLSDSSGDATECKQEPPPLDGGPYLRACPSLFFLARAAARLCSSSSVPSLPVASSDSRLSLALLVMSGRATLYADVFRRGHLQISKRVYAAAVPRCRQWR